MFTELDGSSTAARRQLDGDGRRRGVRALVPVEWLRPYTDDKLSELAERGVRRLVVVSEHIETLEEIDSEYREVAKEAFNQQCYVTPCCSSGGGTRTGKR